MESKISKYYVVKTLRLMNYLAKKFDCKKVQDDNNNKNFKVFLFDDSRELRNYLRKYNNERVVK